MPRRWTSEEVNDLVENVETHYEFLTGPLTNSKTKSMVDAKWLEITEHEIKNAVVQIANELQKAKSEFTQYPFFVRFRPFFYVFASSWKIMRFFIRIFISPYPH